VGQLVVQGYWVVQVVVVVRLKVQPGDDSDIVLVRHAI